MIIHANILDWATSYDGEPFHALLCDPPYHLTENHKRYSSPDAKPPGYGNDGSFRRLARGFMGKTWDGGDVAYRPETWAALAQHLYPGAFGMAFSGSRGWHRMAVAIEDAGLIIHPTIFCWAYGSGFPKATRIDTQVDRQAGATRTKIGTKKHQPKFAAAELGYREKDNGYNSKSRESFDVTAPATDLAQAWQGHRYGMQSMKPAIEPIIVFQKPYAGRPVDSITATGAGALNIDQSRIKTDDDLSKIPTPPKGWKNSSALNGTMTDDWKKGRWPANFALVHHPACERVGVRRVKGNGNPYHRTAVDSDGQYGAVPNAPASSLPTTAYTDPDGRETIANWRCHPDCVVRRLGKQSGESESKQAPRGGTSPNPMSWYQERSDGDLSAGHSDSGTAARFFHQSDWMAERLEESDAVGYFAKASRGEREAGLDPRQIALLRAAGEEIEDFEGQPAQRAALADRRCQKCGGWYPKAWQAQRYPNSICHCEEPDFVYVDFPQTTVDDGRQTPIDNAYLRGETKRRNTHPTIKPIALTRWLATLLLPPAMYAPRRLLIPFAGAGSEMVGAMLAGWEDVTGIELEADHVAIAEARLAYWQQRRWELLDPAAPITAKSSATVDGQRDMFMEDEL